MHVCYLFEIDSNGNKKPGSAKLKLPVIPRCGDGVNLSLVKGNETLTIAGIVRKVDMYCSIEEGDSEFPQDGVPEPKEMTWFIALEQEKEEQDD